MGSRLEKNSKAVWKRIESHVFDNEDGEEYEASNFNELGDYFRRKKIKLQNVDAELRSTSAEKPQIFKGIVAHVNGYTQPTMSELHQMIVSHGGGYLQYLDRKTMATHIIAANLTPKKRVEFKKYRTVKPAWVVESLKAGRLLPWENYRVVDEGVGQRLIGFNDGKVVSLASRQRQGYREQMSNSWFADQLKEDTENIDDSDVGRIDGERLLTPVGDSRLLGESTANEEISLSNHESHRLGKIEAGLGPSSSESFDASSSLETALQTVASDSPQDHTRGGTARADNATERLEDPEESMSNYKLNSDPLSTDTRRHPLVKSKIVPKITKNLTAEEHNAHLLADPHVWNSSAANPGFLKQYYSESRLHHLSAWKADIKAKMQQIAAEKSSSQKQAQKRKAGSRRYILHVDFDSFFCAVSLKNMPEYANMPVAVAHGSGGGSEIASCNYPARAFGVRNGMWMKKALQLCPTIKVLPYDFPAYDEASCGFYGAILDLGGIVQSVSVDEALVDITSLCLPKGGSDGYSISEGSIWQEQAKADEIAQTLRRRIKEITGCEVSVGIGGNILLAKVALRRAKPAGQYQIKPGEVLDFIGELNVQDLPGVAYSIGGRLEEIGVKLVKDIRSLTKERLATVLGPKIGEKIWDYSRGIDQTEVGEQVIRKSVSAEVNWGIRFVSQPEAEEFVQNLCSELHKRLLDNGVKGHQLTIKIMRRAQDAPLDPAKHLGHGKCDTFNKSVVLGVSTNSAEILGREAIHMLRSYGFSPGELRGLGVQMTKLEPLKPYAQGRPDSSQKQLVFNVPAAAQRQFRKEPEDPIVDSDSPQKTKTPIHPAAVIPRANAKDGSAKKALNITGTQFLVPTQVDRMVLTELPQDIRSKLSAQSKSMSTSRAQSESRSHNPSTGSFENIPMTSQLDPEVLDALPEDVKAEVLASYPSQPTHSLSRRGQTLLPQSTRNVDSISFTTTTRMQTTPTKKRGSFLSRGRGAKRDMSRPTLTQSSFITTTSSVGISIGESSKGKDVPAGPESLDPDFLAALPEDVRTEVISEHRHTRLAHLSGLSLNTNRAQKATIAGESNDTTHSKTSQPVQRPRPTFTTAGLSTLPELRLTLGAWHAEFADDGPLADDVAALQRYLRRVVTDEKDMDKAVAIVHWAQWLVTDKGADAAADGRRAWETAIEEMKETIQEAVLERGLGTVEF
jgi:DNA repair protein REV1